MLLTQKKKGCRVQGVGYGGIVGKCRCAAVMEVRQCGRASVRKGVSEKSGKMKEVAGKETETNEMNEQAK